MSKPLHIFRAGRHTAMSGRTIEFSEADVAAIAAVYDAAVHEAPIVVGHPATDDPAYGWVARLSAEAGNLFAEPAKVEPAFAEMVGAGRFTKVSASFYPPEAASNPAPGGWYLKHVGFLGATPPAVKGLRPVELADAAEAEVLEIAFAEAAPAFAETRLSRALNARLDERADGDAAARAALIGRMAEAAGIERGAVLQILRGEIETPPEDRLRGFARVLGMAVGDLTELVSLAENNEGQEKHAMPKGDDDTAAARAAELERREAEIAAREAAFAEREAAARAAEDAALLTRLIEEGRVAPGLRDEMAAFLGALDAEEAVEFAEGKPLTPRQWFRNLLGRARPLIEFGERAGPGDGPPRAVTPEDYAAEATKLIAAAKADGRELSFAEAVRNVEASMENRSDG